MEIAGIFYGPLEYFTVNCFILEPVMLWLFGVFPLVLVHCVKKYLATLNRAPEAGT
jgi:hypothetical protein